MDSEKIIEELRKAANRKRVNLQHNGLGHPYANFVEEDAAEHIATLEEALHEIYGRACQARNSDDESKLWAFAREAEQIALRAKHGKALEGKANCQ